MSCLDGFAHHCARCDNSVDDGDEQVVDGLREQLALLARERDAARAEAAMLREALVDMEDACAQVASWSVESIEYSDAVRVAARAALAATPGDWLAARDRALAERVREACAETAELWPVTMADSRELRRRVVATDLDALVGGKS